MKNNTFLILLIGFVVGWVLRDVTKLELFSLTTPGRKVDNSSASNPLDLTKAGLSSLENSDKTTKTSASRSHLESRKRKLENPEDWPSYELWLEQFDKLQPHTDKHYWLQARATKVLAKDYQLVFIALFNAIEYASGRESLQLSQERLDRAVSDYSINGKSLDGMKKYQQTLEFFHEKDPSHPLGNLALAKLKAYQGNLDQAFSYLDQIEPMSKHQFVVDAFRNKLESKSLSLQRSDIKIPLSRLGNQFIVEAYFDTVPLRLLLDTGASSTVLNREVADNLLKLLPNSFQDTGKTAIISTANGQAASRIFFLSELRVEQFKLNDLKILDAPMAGTESFDGLLGMDFLGRYNFKIDRSNALLVFDGSIENR